LVGKFFEKSPQRFQMIVSRQGVEGINPVVKQSQVIRSVNMTSRYRAIVWQPAQFGRVEESGDTELAVEARVVPVLVVNEDFDPLDLNSDRLEVSTSQ
jgi:hypothetical protein